MLDLAIAFVAGLLAFFSPCFLPLVPAYLIYITGLSFEELSQVRLKTVFHSLIFIFGFSLVFVLLGLTATLLGSLLYQYADILRILGGVLIIVFGLHFLGVFKFFFLDLEKKFTFSSRPAGYLGTFFIGMVFAFGWSPCIGPVLGSILVHAGQSKTVGQGMLLLVSFSLGLGLPLFIVSLAVNFFLGWIKKIERYLEVIHLVAGIFLIIVGILLIGDYFKEIAAWLINLTGYRGI